MKSNSSEGNTSNNKSAMDKIAEKAKDALEKDESKKVNLEGHFQNAPDEGREDVPQSDKIIKDRKTGEETYIENTGDKY
ncbi:hypothetical protein ACSFXN_15715 [Planococcus sp. 1R117A]|uniref:hypothetical protein n=1 Tax=Planococcus sp. 1R117A TaxID=3447020 RepID=UPI003EDC7189